MRALPLVLAATAVAAAAPATVVALGSPSSSRTAGHSATRHDSGPSSSSASAPVIKKFTAKSSSATALSVVARVDANGALTTVTLEALGSDGTWKNISQTSSGDSDDPQAVRFSVSGLAPGVPVTLRVTATSSKGTVTATVTARPGASDDDGGTTPTTPASTTPAGTTPSSTTPSAKPSPVQGETVVVRPDRGRVRYRVPGSTIYREVGEVASIPAGSVVDTTTGQIALTSQVGDEVQRGYFSGGEIRVRQNTATGLTQVVLTEPLDCGPVANPAQASRHAASKKRRHVWGRDNGGKYETHGRDSIAAVRGTRWLTTDTCEGTVVKVFEGAVRVRARGSHGKGVLVRAGGRNFTPHRP